MDESKKEILVADDEPGFQALFRYMLEPRGFHVTTVDNGGEALEMARNKDFSLIILDVHMPKMTGTEVLKNLREFKPHQYVVILSSSGEPDKVKAESDILQADAFFQKPFDTKDIFQVIERFVERTPQEFTQERKL